MVEGEIDQRRTHEIRKVSGANATDERLLLSTLRSHGHSQRSPTIIPAVDHVWESSQASSTTTSLHTSLICTSWLVIRHVWELSQASLPWSLAMSGSRPRHRRRLHHHPLVIRHVRESSQASLTDTVTSTRGDTRTHVRRARQCAARVQH